MIHTYEGALFVLKPDALLRKDVVLAFDALLRRFALATVALRHLWLDDAYLDWLSPRHEPQERAYLVRGPVQARLVWGPDAQTSAYRIKWELRDRFDVAAANENLIHAADEGSETLHAIRMLFPEHLQRPGLIGATDQLWEVRDVDRLRTGLAWAKERHPHGTVLPVIDAMTWEPDAAIEACGELGVPAMTVRRGGQGTLLDPRRPEQGALTVLIDAPDVGSADDWVERAAALGAAALACYMPPWNLTEVACREEACRRGGLVSLGGSGATDRPFAMANSVANRRVLETALARAHGPSSADPNEPMDSSGLTMGRGA
jgi:hypothetical protein